MLNFAQCLEHPWSSGLLASFICDNIPWPPLPLLERRSVVDSVFRKLFRWPQWVMEHPQCKDSIRRSCFRGAAATWLDSATQAVATDLTTAIGIAVGDADGGAKGILY